jgi:hypothetical protein
MTEKGLSDPQSEAVGESILVRRCAPGVGVIGEVAVRGIDGPVHGRGEPAVLGRVDARAFDPPPALRALEV